MEKTKIKGNSIDGSESIKLGVHHTDMDRLGETKKYTPIYCRKCHTRIIMTKETSKFGESIIYFNCPNCGEVVYLYCWDD
jgi:predicted RNA-binding Zn-ribbon protein involved in translation (DUF1610 family)